MQIFSDLSFLTRQSLTTGHDLGLLVGANGRIKVSFYVALMETHPYAYDG